MTGLDWTVLVATLAGIAAWGWWKSRNVKDVAGYVRSNTLSWPTVGLSIMATQASAITFLSTPGQAHEDGLRFVQFYFGLPLAMIVIAAVFVPIYFRLKVYTAYEYLEHRFDARVRYLGAVLFLIQRGLAAGITIYAPAIILSSILGWSLHATVLGIGLFVIAYTVGGGTEAVSQTQKQQMIVMLGGMAIAGIVIAFRLPPDVSLGNAVRLAGALDRVNPVNFHLDFESRYNFWSGIAGGFFLALAYFGTDQSQVQRYLSGRSVTESRLGLLFNGMFKVPMQFGILFVGVLVFVFYMFTKPPIFFNEPTLRKVAETAQAGELEALERRYDAAFEARRSAAVAYVAELDAGEGAGMDGSREAAKAELRERAADVKAVREEARALVGRALPDAETKDADYIFIGFVLKYLPSGVVGLVIAAILCAAMSSTASELAALGSTSTLDLYHRLSRGATAPAPARSADQERRDLRISKLFTALWGLVALGFASFASLVDNLIQAVNILGSIFYGTMLGLFVVAFFLKHVTATPVLIGALFAQATVIALFAFSDLGFLWYNVVGCGIVVVVSLALELARGPARGTA